MQREQRASGERRMVKYDLEHLQVNSEAPPFLLGMGVLSFPPCPPVLQDEFHKANGFCLAAQPQHLAVPQQEFHLEVPKEGKWGAHRKAGI